MNQIRLKILFLLNNRQLTFIRVFRFVLSFVALFLLSINYGYFQVLSSPGMVILLAGVCAFLPFSAMGEILFLYMGLQLYFLSLPICISYLALSTLLYLICRCFFSKRSFYIFLLPALYVIYLPYLCAVHEGFFGKRQNVCPLALGGVLAFFMRYVKLYEATLKSEGSWEAVGIVFSDMFSNPNFYIFVISFIVLFLCIYNLSRLRIKNAWKIALFSAVAAEFLLMIGGYVLSNNFTRIPNLLLANMTAVIFGVVYMLLFEREKTEHIRELDFEDEEYTYHVIAYPKISIEQGEYDHRRITQAKRLEESIEDGGENQ